MPTETLSVCPGGESAFALDVPAAPDIGQAFRAPDLVWSRRGDELIVLLKSMNQAGNVFRFIWLQRFSLSGTAIGPSVNLCDRGLLPERLRQDNFEGLGWFDAENVVLVNDSNQPARQS